MNSAREQVEHAGPQRGVRGRRGTAGATGVGADLALDPTGALWQDFVDGSRPGGRIEVVGKMATPTAVLRVQSVYWKQVDVRGSSMGGPSDFSALLAHIESHQWAPKVDSTFSIEDVTRAYQRLDASDRVGKVVLRMDPAVT